jgi:hypothetical protein
MHKIIILLIGLCGCEDMYTEGGSEDGVEKKILDLRGKK